MMTYFVIQRIPPRNPTGTLPSSHSSLPDRSVNPCSTILTNTVCTVYTALELDISVVYIALELAVSTTCTCRNLRSRYLS